MPEFIRASSVGVFREYVTGVSRNADVAHEVYLGQERWKVA
jgi:hypothetical protein